MKLNDSVMYILQILMPSIFLIVPIVLLVIIVELVKKYKIKKEVDYYYKNVDFDLTYAMNCTSKYYADLFLESYVIYFTRKTNVSEQKAIELCKKILQKHASYYDKETENRIYELFIKN